MYFYITDHTLQKFDGYNLPTKAQVLCRFQHLNLIDKIDRKTSIKNVTKEIIALYQKANIPTMEDHKIGLKFDRMFDQYNKLKKNRLRDSSTQKKMKKISNSNQINCLMFQKQMHWI